MRVLATGTFLVAIIGSGILLMQAAISRVVVSWPDVPQNYVVRIVSLPKSAARSTGMEAEVLHGANVGRHIRLYLSDSVPARAGDRLLIHTRIEMPKPSGNPYAFDWPAYLLTQGISGTAYASKSASLPSDTTFSLRVWALRVQAAAVERLQTHFEGTDLAMLAAMTLGDKRGLDAGVRAMFSETGTSHVLALSGLHLGILFMLYQFLVLNRVRRRSLRWVAVAVGLALVWLYALVAGMPLSMQRAALMFSWVQLMQLSRRDTLGFDRLLVSALLLLLLSPLSLFDVGFQLSFLSVTAILTLVPLFPALPKNSNRVWHVFYSAGLTSCCAWLGTMPVVAYYFHTVSLYSLPANLVAVSLVWILLILSTLFFTFPFAAEIFAMSMKMVLAALTASLSFLATLPGSSMKLFPTPWGVCIALSMLVAIVLWRQRRSRIFGPVALVLLCALILEESYAHRSSRLHPQIVFYNLWRGSAVQAIRADGASYLWMHGADVDEVLRPAAQEFWEQENIQPPMRLDTAFRDQFLYYSHPFLAFGGRRVALLCDKQFKDSTKIVPADYLLVTKGYSGNPVQSLRRYPHATVVLDASLGPIYRRMWHASTDSLHRTVHDMERDGALVVDLKEP